MATVNFSVPEEIRDRFNKTFAGRNKSAILSRLMEQAVEEEERRQRRSQAIGELLKLRERAPEVPASKVSQVRRRARR